MMTSMSERGDAEKFAKLGFHGYFPKPTTTEDLLKALAVVAQGGEALARAEPLVTRHFLHETESSQRKINLAAQHATRILVVEDNRVNQMVATGVLAKLGLDAGVAANGIEALRLLAQSSKQKGYGLVLMDCQMPEMDGYQATKAIRKGQAGEHNSAIPIIAMTANAMQGDREKCLSVGMDDYLVKPIQVQQVKKILAHWLPNYKINNTNPNE